MLASSVYRWGLVLPVSADMPWDELRDRGEPDEREQLACTPDALDRCVCGTFRANHGEFCGNTHYRFTNELGSTICCPDVTQDVLDGIERDLETLRLVWERRQFYKLGAQNPSPRGDSPRLLDADELSARKDWPR